MSRRRIMEAGTLLFLLALAVRLVYLYDSTDSPAFLLPIVDSYAYSQAAASLARGEGFASTFFFQPFLYPFFLSGIFLATGASIAAAKIAQALLGGLTCFLTYRLGLKIFGRGPAIAAGLIVAFYGPLIFFETELLGTGLAAFFFVLLVLLFLKAAEEGTGRAFFLLGLCGALSVLARPTFLPVMVVGCIWLAAVFQPPPGQRIRRTAAALLLAAGFIVPLLPVALANRHTTGHFGFLPASGGLNLYIGNNPESDETITARPGSRWSDVIDLPKRHGVRGDMWDRQQFYLSEVGRYAASEPLDFAAGLGEKAVQFIGSRETARNVDIYLFGKWSWLLGALVWKAGSFGFPFGLLLPLALLGVVLRQRKTPLIVWLSVVVFSLSIVLVFVAARYRLPVIPILAVLAGAGVVNVARAIGARRWKELALAGGLSAGTVFLSTLPGPFPAEEIDYEPELHCCLADTLQRADRVDLAVEEFEKAIALDRENADAHANVAELFFRKGNSRKAIESCRRALRIKPDLPQALCNMAVWLKTEGKLDEATALCLEGLKIRPHEEAFLFNLASIHAELNQPGKVKEYLERVLDLEPAHAAALFELARLHEREGRIGEAIDLCERAAAAGAPDWDMLNTLGGLLFKAGEYEEAAERFRAGLECEPENTILLRNLARALDKLGRLDEAAEKLRRVLRIEPGEARVAFDLGHMLVRAGRYAEAVGPLGVAVSASPHVPETRHTLAVALATCGRADEAIEQYRIILENRPGFVPSLSGLSWLLATHPDSALRNGGEAVALAERALQSGGRGPNVLNTLAAAYAAVGRFEEAAATASEAIGLAEKVGQARLAGQIRTRLELYEKQKPWREPAPR